MGRLINNEQQWRQRAQEARKLAKRMDDAQANQAMLEVAESNDHLAERAKQRKKSD